MKDLGIQFAVLWGEEIGSSFSPEEQLKAAKMKVYDSQELTSMFDEWAREFVDGHYDDTVEFFNEKLEELLKNY